MRIEVAAEYYPRLMKWHVRQALKWIDPVDSAGIEFIRLMDESPDDSEFGKQPAYFRGLRTGGMYMLEYKDTPPHIILYTRSLYLGIPSIFKLTPVATLMVAFTLAHEIAHHVITKRGYIYEPTEKHKYNRFKKYDKYEEGMCNNYALEVIKKMSATWYYKIGDWLRRHISKHYSIRAEVVWEKQEYKRAAHYWFCAYLLDSENARAAHGYSQAAAKLNLPHAQPAKSLHQTIPQRGLH
jgi:hypothetical protein